MKETIEKIEELIRSFYQIKVNQEKIDYTRIPLAAPIYDSKEAIRGIRTILNGWISQGENVKKFENDFANYIGCYFGIAVNSGSSANLLALLALKEKYNLQDGDEVIIPAATFATVAMPIIQAGFVPLYVDVSRVTLNIDPKQIENAISSKFLSEEFKDNSIISVKVTNDKLQFTQFSKRKSKKKSVDMT